MNTTSHNSPKPTLEELTQEIKAKVKNHLKVEMQGVSISENHTTQQGTLFSQDRLLTPQNNASHLTSLTSKELSKLNESHHFPRTALDPNQIQSHRPVLGKFIVFVKRKILNFLKNGIFRKYFEDHASFNLHLVKLQNSIAQETQRNAWFAQAQEIGEGSGNASELKKQLEDNTKSLLGNIASLENRFNELSLKLQTLDGVTKGLETILMNFSKPQSQFVNSISSTPGNQTLHNQHQTNQVVDSSANREDEASLNKNHNNEVFNSTHPNNTTSNSAFLNSKENNVLPDLTYLLLENRYRGSEQEIKSRLQSYPAYFKESYLRDTSKKILEIGCGRGELLELFKEQGIDALGVELDAAMKTLCQSKGLEVRQGDCLEVLKTLENQSLGGVIAIQVVEHFRIDYLKEFLNQCKAKLAPNCRIILETINTESMVALCRNYFRDPTHFAPLHPETLSFLLQQAGFSNIEVAKRSQFPEAGILQKIPSNPNVPQVKAPFEVINNNIQLLNDYLFGYQDYMVLGHA